jgi:methionyl-tRNA synthetase
LKKTDPARMEAVLWTTSEVLRIIGILIQPVVPQAAAKLLDLLSVAQDERAFAALDPAFAMKPGTLLPAPEGIFPRFVEPAADA